LNFYPKEKLFLLALYSTLQSLEIFDGKEGEILYFLKSEQLYLLEKKWNIGRLVTGPGPLGQSSPSLL
jgi:hypothetical protein